MDDGERTAQLYKSVEHQKVITSASLFMATIGKNLAGEFLLEKAHGTAVHRPSIRSSELKPSKGKSREVFEPVVTAMAVLRMSL